MKSESFILKGVLSRRDRGMEDNGRCWGDVNKLKSIATEAHGHPCENT